MTLLLVSEHVQVLIIGEFLVWPAIWCPPGQECSFGPGMPAAGHRKNEINHSYKKEEEEEIKCFEPPSGKANQLIPILMLLP